MGKKDKYYPIDKVKNTEISSTQDELEKEGITARLRAGRWCSRVVITWLINGLFIVITDNDRERHHG